MNNQICDFYDTKIMIDLDGSVSRSLKINEPFIMLEDDEGTQDIYLMDSEKFLFNALDKDEMFEINDWAKSYRNEIMECIDNKIVRNISNLKKGV